MSESGKTRAARSICSVAFAGGIAAIAAASANAAGDAAHGQQLYTARCIACHSLDENRVGPKHRGVYGRKAGRAESYDYSPALRQTTIVWNDTTLDRWLADPEKLIPGQKMGYQVPEAADREDLIAFLKRESAQ